MPGITLSTILPKPFVSPGASDERVTGECLLKGAQSEVVDLRVASSRSPEAIGGLWVAAARSKLTAVYHGIRIPPTESIFIEPDGLTLNNRSVNDQVIVSGFCSW